MKKMISVFVTTLAIGALAQAAQTPQEISKDAALKAAGDKFKVTCSEKETKQVGNSPRNGSQTWKVTVTCSGHFDRDYIVHLNVAGDEGGFSVRDTMLLPLNGTRCGLSDNWGGDDEKGSDWQFDDKREINLTGMSKKAIQSLPQLVQEQLIVTANNMSDEPVDNVTKAVLVMKSDMKDGEAYVKYFSYNGVNYTATVSYPGDNAVGLIFKEGSAVPFAENGDDFIVCSEAP
jgi:hypothetical protein